MVKVNLDPVEQPLPSPSRCLPWTLRSATTKKWAATSLLAPGSDQDSPSDRPEVFSVGSSPHTSQIPRTPPHSSAARARMVEQLDFSEPEDFFQVHAARKRAWVLQAPASTPVVFVSHTPNFPNAMRTDACIVEAIVVSQAMVSHMGWALPPVAYLQRVLEMGLFVFKQRSSFCRYLKSSTLPSTSQTAAISFSVDTPMGPVNPSSHHAPSPVETFTSRHRPSPSRALLLSSRPDSPVGPSPSRSGGVLAPF